MEVKKRYKQTEVGVIPEDWQQTFVGEITTKVGSGITPTGGNSNYKQAGRPFVRSQNVGWGVLLLDDLVFIDDDLHATFSSSETQNGDVLLNITGASIGRSAIVDSVIARGNVNQHVCILRLNQCRCLPKFLNSLLLSPIGQKQIDSFQAGGNRQGLNFGQIRGIRIPLPPTLAEQEAIAGALSDADAWIKSLEQLIAKKRQIKQGAMQELLTGKKRLPGFRGEWRTVVLRECLKMPATYGIVKAGEFQSNGIPMVRGGDIKEGSIGEGLPFVTQEKSDEFKRTVLEEGDVVIALVGYPGEAAKVPPRYFGANVSRAVGLLRLRETVDVNYLVSYLNSPMGREIVLAPSAGSAQVVVNLRELNKLAFPFPPTQIEQSAIAAILCDLEAEIGALESELAKALEIKQGMMQQLLTGRIRLV